MEFLTDEELCKVTEYTAPAKQRKELQRLGIRFLPSRSGKPIVLRDVARKALGGDVTYRHGDYVPPNLED